MQVANPNRAQFTKCARTAIPYTTYLNKEFSRLEKENIRSIFLFVFLITFNAKPNHLFHELTLLPHIKRACIHKPQKNKSNVHFTQVPAFCKHVLHSP